MSGYLTVLSGFGGKAAAAILVEYDGKRLLLDAGGSLEFDTYKGWEFPENLDAIIISHDHIDHSAGLLELHENVPVYATSPVLQLLPTHLNLKELPLTGDINIQGIDVSVGQAGHSLGGVWIHLHIGKGVFYSGDFSLESTLFNFDIPAPAELALIDTSYGLYDDCLEQGKKQLSALIKANKKIVMPVPPSGRALEIALWLTEIGEEDWSLGPDCLKVSEIKKMNPQLFHPQLIKKIHSGEQFIGNDIDKEYRDSAKIVITGDADGVAGEAGRLIKQSNKHHSNITSLTIYTGYLPGKAKRDVGEGRAAVVRWNVHPRSCDITWLIEQLSCERCLPLFSRIDDQRLWRQSISDCLVFDTHLRI